MFKSFHRVFSDSLDGLREMIDGLKEIAGGMIRFVGMLLLFLIFIGIVPFTLPLEIYLRYKDKKRNEKR